MKPETRSELDRVLNTYDEQLTEKRKTAQQSKQEDLRFESQVNILCKNTIRPAMEEVGAALRERGHSFVIKDSKEMASVHVGHMSNIILGMEIIPKDAKPSDEDKKELLRHILVELEKDQRKVRFGYQSHREGGYGHGYRVDEVTMESVEQEIMKLLDRVLRSRAQSLDVA